MRVCVCVVLCGMGLAPRPHSGGDGTLGYACSRHSTAYCNGIGGPRESHDITNSAPKTVRMLMCVCNFATHFGECVAGDERGCQQAFWRRACVCVSV